MIADPLFYALAVPAILLTGISKGGFGTGIGMMAVPLMSLAIPVPQAAAVAGNMTTALALVPLAPIGILAGTWMLKRVDDVLFLRVCCVFLLLSGLKLSWDGLTWLVR